MNIISVNTVVRCGACAGCIGLQARILSVRIYEAGVIAYEVGWWSGSDWKIATLPESEVSPANDAQKKQKIGFKL